MNILVFPCGSEIALEINRSLSKVKNFNIFGASSVNDSGRYNFENYIGDVPNINDDNFINHIKDIVINYKIDAIFPCLDIAIPILKGSEELLNCKVVSPSRDTSEICLSKRKTYEKLKDLIRVPDEYTKDNIKSFPVFLKPEIGSSSRFTYLVKDINQLEFYLSIKPDLMILENLPGDEFTIDCFTDFNGNIKFIGARERNRIINGISVESSIIKDEKINQIAKKISDRLNMNGSWFFQLKKDINNEYALLEVACRFGGSSLIQRYLGVNFSHLSLLNSFNTQTEILLNDFNITTCRNLDVKFKIDLNFDNVYVDYDDTIIINDKINSDLIKALHEFINSGKKVILISKHKGNIVKSLKKFRIYELFDDIIHIKSDDDKSKYIKGKSIFIDDSFSERKNVKNKLGLYTFEPCAVDCLI